MLHPSKAPDESGNYNHPMRVTYRLGISINLVSSRLGAVNYYANLRFNRAGMRTIGEKNLRLRAKSSSCLVRGVARRVWTGRSCVRGFTSKRYVTPDSLANSAVLFKALYRRLMFICMFFC